MSSTRLLNIKKRWNALAVLQSEGITHIKNPSISKMIDEKVNCLSPKPNMSSSSVPSAPIKYKKHTSNLENLDASVIKSLKYY